MSGTVEVEDVTGLLDDLGYLDRDDINFNKALFEVGVSFSNGLVYVDVSYQFRKFLQTVARSTCRVFTLELASASEPRMRGPIA